MSFQRIDIRLGWCSITTEYEECNEVKCVFKWLKVKLHIVQAVMHKTNLKKIQTDSMQLIHAFSSLKDSTKKSFQFWFCKQ